MADAPKGRSVAPGANSREAARSVVAAVILVLLTAGAWLYFLLDRAPGTDAALRGFPLDDGWIHMVYARSLAREGGLHYNVGVPEAGMTSPLWVVLLAGVHLVAGGGASAAERVVIGAKILSLAFGAAGVLALRGLARDLGERESVACVAAGLAAIDPSLTFSRAAGMEVPLFVFLTLAAVRASLARRALLAGAMAGLSLVARPEGVVLMPLYAALLLRQGARGRAGTAKAADTRGRGQSARVLALGALLAALPAAAYGAFCLHAVGAPLPNTFYAKFSPQNLLSAGYLLFGWRHYVHDNLPYFTLEAGALLAALGFAALARRRGLVGLVPAAAGAALFVAALASRTYSPGHFFYWERWLIPSFPFLLLGIGAGLGEVLAGFSGLRRATPERGPRVAWRFAAAAALALVLWRVPAAFAERADLFAWNAQNIEEMNVALGRWVNESLPPDAVVAVNDAGAIRYFGERTTIDLMGLNDHRILRRDPREGFRPLFDRGVGYFIIFPSWFPDFDRALPLAPIHQVRSPHYTICEGPQDLMIVYRLEKP